MGNYCCGQQMTWHWDSNRFFCEECGYYEEIIDEDTQRLILFLQTQQTTAHPKDSEVLLSE
jgi:hypothetical protein